MTVPSAAETLTGAGAASQHVLVMLIDRRNTGLERVMSLFRRRGPEFTSMHIEPSADPDVVRLTVYITATAEAIEHAMLHLRKIVDIQALHNLSI
jgi:acetolactate synthase small subunit